jgi:hypothetical protein
MVDDTRPSSRRTCCTNARSHSIRPCSKKHHIKPWQKVAQLQHMESKHNVALFHRFLPGGALRCSIFTTPPVVHDRINFTPAASGVRVLRFHEVQPEMLV